jgi:hypothetical protein
MRKLLDRHYVFTQIFILNRNLKGILQKCLAVVTKLCAVIKLGHLAVPVTTAMTMWTCYCYSTC